MAQHETRQNSVEGVSCIIPALNEENAIAQTVEEARAALSNSIATAHEIIVVDDGSTDNTAAIALAAGARVISNPTNTGYGRALKTGIDAAQYDTIVITDADGTYPIYFIPELLKVYARGFCLVIAQRQGAAYRESLFKSTLRCILRWIVEFVSGRKVPDVNSGLRVFSRKTIRTYYNHMCDTFSFTSSQTLAYLMSARLVTFVPVQYSPRIGHTKVKLFRDALRSLQYIFQQAVYYNPLKIFFLFTFCCLMLSLFFLLIGVLFQVKIAFILSAGSFLFSILVTSMGILGELLKQIMDNRRPGE